MANVTTKKIELADTPPTKCWLSEGQVAEMLNISVSKLRADRHNSKGLPYVKFGKAVRYKLTDLFGYIDANRVDPQR